VSGPHFFRPWIDDHSVCAICGYPQKFHDTDNPALNDPHPERTRPMTTPIPFTHTQDTITVFVDGTPYTFAAGTAQYHGLRDAIFRQDWDAVPRHLTVAGALQQWLCDRFTVDSANLISYQGYHLPDTMSRRIVAMVTAGESPAPLFAFYERLARNPSHRSVQNLWSFLQHSGIPLETDGTFLAYKGVSADLKDMRTGHIDNSPGQTVRMPRNQISDDSRKTCEQGLHVGALEYAKDWGPRVVICRVDPEHIVCVPDDYDGQKMRTCEYTVVGEWINTGEALPSTTMQVEDEGVDDEWGGDVEYDDDDDEIDDEIEEVAKSKPKRVVVTTNPTKPKAAAFARMNPGKLMEQSIDDLRKYASAHLKIIGAYKIPGGKSALVSAVLKARRKHKRKR